MDIILPPKKNVILDATMLTAIMSCGRFADNRFNHCFHSIKGKSNSLEVGSLIHKILEVTYKHIIKGFKRDDAINFGLVAGQMYVDGCPYCANAKEGDKPECGHVVQEYPGVQNTPADNDRHIIGWRWALQTCEDYFKHYYADSWIPLEVEVVKGKVLYEDDEIRIMWKAKFDWIVDTNQGIFPSDHKSFKQRRDKTKLNNQFIGQCLLADTRSVIINKIGLQTSLKPQERFTRDFVSYSSAALLEWQSEILPYWAYKWIQYDESGYYPPNFASCDDFFGGCVFKDVCEADPIMRVEVLRGGFIVGPRWDVHNPKGDEND